MQMDRSTFKTDQKPIDETFEPLVTTKSRVRKVASPTANNFNNDALDTLSPPISKPVTLSNEAPKTSKKRGRPIEIKDARYKVCRPKMISPALEAKLDTMKDYVTEFQTVTGRITFEKYLTTLVDAYVVEKLSYSKQDSFKEEYERALENLLK